MGGKLKAAPYGCGFFTRSDGGLLVNRKEMKIVNLQILSYSATGNDKIAFGISIGFKAQIEDFRLKRCILGKNSKNNIAEGNERVPLSVFSASSEVSLWKFFENGGKK